MTLGRWNVAHTLSPGFFALILVATCGSGAFAFSQQKSDMLLPSPSVAELKLPEAPTPNLFLQQDKKPAPPAPPAGAPSLDDLG